MCVCSACVLFCHLYWLSWFHVPQASLRRVLNRGCICYQMTLTRGETIVVTAVVLKGQNNMHSQKIRMCTVMWWEGVYSDVVGGVQ